MTRSPYRWPDDWRVHGDFRAWYTLFGFLKSQYGPARAQSIVEGEDEKSNADLESWRRLGRR